MPETTVASATGRHHVHESVRAADLDVKAGPIEDVPELNRCAPSFHDQVAAVVDVAGLHLNLGVASGGLRDEHGSAGTKCAVERREQRRQDLVGDVLDEKQATAQSQTRWGFHRHRSVTSKSTL